jgi:ABC-type Zn2+ transport system substrate-binding protein/surface adhesin
MAKLFDEGYYYFSDIYRLNTTYYFNVMNEETPDQRKFYSQFVFN